MKIWLSWFLYWLGDKISRVPNYPYGVYTWLMAKSEKLQGDNPKGPWF